MKYSIQDFAYNFFSSRARFLRLAVFVFCAWLLSACYSTGISYDSDGAKALEPNVSTYDDALLVMGGPPTTVYPRPDGSKWALWQYSRSLMPDAIYFARTTMLEFDPHDIFVREVPYAK